jgi:hypothetical protein
MDDKSMTGGISPERLSGLFRIAMEVEEGSPPASPTEAKEHLLRAALAGYLPAENEVLKVLPALAGQLHLLGCRPLGESLLDPGMPLEVLKAIKDHGKRQAKAAKNAKNRAEHTVAVTIYFAAIAGALRFHGRKITSYSWAALAEHFGALTEKPWMAPELVGHFVAARDLCRGKDA